MIKISKFFLKKCIYFDPLQIIHKNRNGSVIQYPANAKIASKS